MVRIECAAARLVILPQNKFIFNNFFHLILFQMCSRIEAFRNRKIVLISKSVNLKIFLNIRTVGCLLQWVYCTFKSTKKLNCGNLD